MQHRTVRNSSFCVALFFVAGGCSTFERDWRAEVAPSDGLVGRWEGTWSSEVTGHTGRLRCILAPTENNAYDARFHALYGGILTFEYTARLSAKREAGRWSLTGQEDLGWLAGGLYHYDATVIGDAFEATYRSKKDNGVFRMKRSE